METRVSEEINQFVKKKQPQELAFDRFLYLGFGGSNRYFCQRLYLNPPNITLQGEIIRCRKVKHFLCEFSFFDTQPIHLLDTLAFYEYGFVQHFVIFLSGNK